MKKFRWQLLIILATGFLVGVLLIIQQLDNGEELSLEPSPITGGVYTEALTGNFMRLNPFLDIYNPPDQAVGRLIFNGLVRFNHRGLPQPDLAESWGISRDGTVYNINLRTDVIWHDGETFSSNDVLYSIDLLQTDHGLIPGDLQEFWQEVEVVALSESQLQFLLPEPFAPFLDYLTFGILPEHILGGLNLDDIIDHPYNLAPVGTGPFRFQRLLVEEDQIVGVVLEAFEGFFQDRPFLDEFIFRYYPTSSDALDAYQRGEVEGIGDVDLDILDQVLAQPNLAIYTARKPLLTMVYLNLNNPEVGFLQSPEFRLALMKSINRQVIIDSVYAGQAVLANGPILPGTWAYYRDLERLDYDPVEAQNWFKSTGVQFDEEEEIFISEGGIPVVLTLLHPATTNHRLMAEKIRSDWQTLGVEVALDARPYEEVLEALEAREYQTALVDINLTRSPDPDPYPFWGQAQTQTGQNYAEWDNRTASEFLEQARMTVDFGERERLYRNFQVLFMREMPSLPLFYPTYTYAVTQDINGVNFGPIFEPGDRFNNVHTWFILTRTEPAEVQIEENSNEFEE